MCDRPEEAEHEVFRPPSIPTEVFCLHCRREYSSYLIHWREEVGRDGVKRGFWCCPTPGCDGLGFGFDIFPIDPDYVDEHTGEKMWDDDEDDEWDEDEPGHLEQCIVDEMMHPCEHVIEGDEPVCTGLPDIGLAIGHEAWIECTLNDPRSAQTTGDDHDLPDHGENRDEDIPF